MLESQNSSWFLFVLIPAPTCYGPGWQAPRCKFSFIATQQRVRSPFAIMYISLDELRVDLGRNRDALSNLSLQAKKSSAEQCTRPGEDNSEAKQQETAARRLTENLEPSSSTHCKLVQTRQASQGNTSPSCLACGQAPDAEAGAPVVPEGRETRSSVPWNPSPSSVFRTRCPRSPRTPKASPCPCSLPAPSWLGCLGSPAMLEVERPSPVRSLEPGEGISWDPVLERSGTWLQLPGGRQAGRG